MAEEKTILLIEDNVQLNEINRRALTRVGYTVRTALTLAEARTYLERTHFDVIILDIMLPDGSGVEFCREIREKTVAPILFLTSVSGYEQTLEGLGAGGDDYLNKPFDLNLLLAKVAAFLRRDEIAARVRAASDVLSVGPLILDIIAQKVYLSGLDLHLTPKEFSLLLLLAQNEGHPISKEYLFEVIWKQPVNADTRTVKNHLSAIRKKLAGSGYTIAAFRGDGYCLEKADEA